MADYISNSKANTDSLSKWSDVVYWQKLCPYLTITSKDVKFDGEKFKDDGAPKQQLLERINDDGYALLNSTICSDNLRKEVSRGVSELEVKHAIPATFVLLFDETWELAAASHQLLLRNNENQQDEKKNGILKHANKMKFNFDMLAWHIDPCLDQAGFSPHRDRQPDALSALQQSFYLDGQAKYITHWIALEDASPENSCLYVIPKQFDPGYLKGDDPPEEEDNDEKKKQTDGETAKGSNETEQFTDPLSRALSTKQAYQNIRAVPRQAGQSLIFTHRILHWGSKGNRHALDNQPRVAISFVYSDVDFEAPYLVSHESFSEDEHGKWTCPPFEIRLLLVCSQLLIYYQRFNLSASTLRACYDYCKSNSDKLHPAYCKKVFVEFVKAMKERRDGIADNRDVEDNEANGNHSKNGTQQEEEPNSEDEEALLEAMLDNNDEFEDDYDDMVYTDDEKGRDPKKRKCN